MAVRSKDELLTGIKAVIGESTDDAAIALLEDVTDTLDDMASRDFTEEVEILKQKLKDLDAEWRQKYRDRFYSTESERDETQSRQAQPDSENVTIKSYEELFTEEG